MKKVLVVDDEEMDRILISHVLKRPEYELIFASNGNKAFERYQEGDIDVVVTDLVMPDCNGFQLIRELKNYDKNVCIVAVSGHGRQHLDYAKADGAITALPKPFQPAALLEAVEELTRIRTLKMDPWRQNWPAHMIRPQGRTAASY